MQSNRAQGEAYVFSGADSASEILVSAPHQTVDEFQIQGLFVFNGWDGCHLITFDNPNPHQGSKFGYTASP